MRKLVANLLIGVSSIFAISFAAADPTPVPTLSAAEQYKVDFAAYQEAMRARETQVRAIFNTFNISVNKAKADYQGALAAAKSADLKYQAKIAYKNAVQSAVNTYDSAIAALGAPPVPPQKPMKMAKPQQMQPTKKAKN